MSVSREPEPNKDSQAATAELGIADLLDSPHQPIPKLAAANAVATP
jgi:hypothetical protein